jgi:hypothetical protein
MYRLIFLITVIGLWSCNTTRVVKPLEKGELQAGANLGGPLFKLGSAPLFMPLSSLHAAYGCKEHTTAFASLHTTALLFGVLQTDLGITRQLIQQNNYIPGISVSPIANMMIDRWDGRFSFFPQLDINAYWNYRSKPHFFYTGLNNWFEFRNKRAHGETQPTFILPTLHLGHQWCKSKYNIQLELKYIGFTQPNQPVVVNYISPASTGTLGIYFGINRKF